MEPPPRIPRRVPAALACLALLACGGGHPPSPAPPAPTPPSPAPSADPGAPASGPGSTLWEVELHYDSDQLGGPWTDGDGNLFMIHLSGGQITAEKRDASGAVEWERHVEPACSHGWFALGATDDGRFAVEVASCPYGSAYRPTAERVTLLDPGGAVASQFTTGWGAALAVNGFGETYAVSSDVGAPVVPSPDGSSLVSGWPVLLRLIRPDGTDAWVDREGPPSLLPGSLQATHDGGAVALSGDGRTASGSTGAGTSCGLPTSP